MKLNTKMNLKVVTSLSFAMLCFGSFAQDSENLVPNGSFESTEKNPKRLGSIAYASGWSSPTGVRADLFSGDKIPDIGAPDNIYGTEAAKDGGNYVGIVAYSYGDKVPRSYVTTKMDSPMKKGLRYCVKFNVSLAEASKYSCNNLAARFDSRARSTEAKVPMIADEDEELLMHFNNEMKIMSARYNWTEICGMYTAKGGEKYITLGNFMSDADTKSERMKKDPNVRVKELIAAYYYIDDISVQLIDEEKGEVCDCANGEAAESYSTTIYQRVFNITEKMTPAEKIEANQIYFAFGRDAMSPEGKSSLDMIAEIMKANPEMKLQVIGHNNEEEDEVGLENDFYAGMDGKRVGSVMTYLTEKGIDSSRLIAAQKGSEILSDEVTAEDDEDLAQAKSRRVTFKVR